MYFIERTCHPHRQITIPRPHIHTYNIFAYAQPTSTPPTKTSTQPKPQVEREPSLHVMNITSAQKDMERALSFWSSHAFIYDPGTYVCGIYVYICVCLPLTEGGTRHPTYIYDIPPSLTPHMTRSPPSTTEGMEPYFEATWEDVLAQKKRKIGSAAQRCVCCYVSVYIYTLLGLSSLTRLYTHQYFFSYTPIHTPPYTHRAKKRRLLKNKRRRKKRMKELARRRLEEAEAVKVRIIVSRIIVCVWPIDGGGADDNIRDFTHARGERSNRRRRHRRRRQRWGHSQSKGRRLRMPRQQWHPQQSRCRGRRDSRWLWSLWRLLRGRGREGSAGASGRGARGCSSSR